MDGFVAIGRPSAAERCAFCHDALGDAWDVCSGCNTRLHAECRAQAVDCPTLGCRWSLRNAWSMRGRRPRPGFRLALARLAARQSGEVVFEPAPRANEGALERFMELGGPTLSLIGHSLVSPFALVFFTAWFLAAFVPAHWAGTLIRRRGLSDRVRDSVRGPAASFAFEAVAAPFVALALVGVATPLAFASVPPDMVPLPPAVLIAALVAPALAVLPPALGWFGRE